MSFVLKRFGININQRQLAQYMRTTTEHGTSPNMLVKAATTFGIYDSKFINGNVYILQRLKASGKEIIVNWMDGENEADDGHYSVFSSATDKIVTLQDPKWGALVAMRRSIFERQWYDVDKGVKVKGWALVMSHPKP